MDAADLTALERRAALDACATAVHEQPIDYLIERVSLLAPHDPRTEIYGDLAANWSPTELAQSAVSTKLLAIFNGAGTNGSARVVALRALAAIPADQRPAEVRAIDQVTIEINALPSQMSYDKKNFSVSPGCLVHLILHNPDALEHNLLIVAPGALAEMGIAGDRMGQTPDGKAKEFVPPSPKVLTVMGLVAPGKSKSLWFVAPMKAATYPYVCTYPSHWRTMNGKMKVVAPESNP